MILTKKKLYIYCRIPRNHKDNTHNVNRKGTIT